MKNYLVFIVFIIFCLPVFAQTGKGNFALSGKTDLSFLFSKTTIGTDSIETGKIKSNQYGFTLGAGYFIADNFSAGISGTWSYNYTETETLSGQTFRTANIIQSYTILPQVAYYFAVSGKLKPVLAAGVGYAWVEERDSRIMENNNKLYSFSGVSYVGSAGASYFINKSISIDLGLQYSHNRLKDKLQPNVMHKENIIAAKLGVSVFL